MIILHHLVIHGQWNLEVLQDNQILYTVMQSICFLGKIGVNIFILITGYFLINSKGIKIAKMVRLWLTVLFYSIVIAALFAIFRGETYSTVQIVMIFTPVLSALWWFVTPYFAVLIASPFLNTLISMMSRRMHLALCLVLIVIQSIITIFTGIPLAYDVFFGSPLGYNMFVWFFTLYIIGAYIGRYSSDFCSMRTYVLLLVASVVAMVAMAVAFVYLGPENGFISWCIDNIANFGYLHGFLYMRETNIVMLVAALSFFLIFKNIKLSYNPIINTLALTVFGIYLIHDDVQFRVFMYAEIIKCPEYTDPMMIAVAILISLVCIFVICAIIELARMRLFDYVEKHLRSFVSSHNW